MLSIVINLSAQQIFTNSKRDKGVELEPHAAMAYDITAERGRVDIFSSKPMVRM